MAELAPSILSADFARLAEQAALVESAGVGLLHIDVMDGHFVPNITMGPPIVASLRAATELFLDCHLMIENPDDYSPAFIAAGAQNVTVHQEACPHLNRSLQLIRDHGAQAGVALNPATPIDTLEHVLEMVDLVLVMTVNPGFGGQSFIPSTLDKISALDRIRSERGLEFKIETDGGLGPANVAEVVRRGCDWIVAGSSVFRTPDPALAVTEIKERMAEAHTLQA